MKTLTRTSRNQKFFNAKGARDANDFNIFPLASLAPFAFNFTQRALRLAQKARIWLISA
jgi:hypothetical protein